MGSVAALSHTCRTFYHLVNQQYLRLISVRLVATNQSSHQIINRTYQPLSSLGKIYVNKRWRRRNYRESAVLLSKKKYRPWLCLQEDHVYVAQGDCVYKHLRTADGVCSRPSICYTGNTDDVNRIVVTANYVITCANDGRLIAWADNSNTQLFSHSQSVRWNECLFMDEARHVIAVGLNSSAAVQFFRLEANSFELLKEINASDRVWSVALSEDSRYCVVGTAGHMAPPLAVYDIQRETYKMQFPDKYKLGAGVFASMWEDEHVVLTGSYDTYVRLWDTRSGKEVRAWPDPYDSAIYSVASDHAYTVLAGTARHGRVTMYDLRHSNCIQMYHMPGNRGGGGGGGPVYSVQFDPCFMFVALESSVHVLNFAYSSKSSRLRII